MFHMFDHHEIVNQIGLLLKYQDQSANLIDPWTQRTSRCSHRLSARVRGDGEGAGCHGEADGQGQGGRGAERVAGVSLSEVS